MNHLHPNYHIASTSCDWCDRTADAAQVLDEFYTNLSSVGVSAITGEGMHELFDAAKACRREYNTDYKPDLDKKLKVSWLSMLLLLQL